MMYLKRTLTPLAACVLAASAGIAAAAEPEIVASDIWLRKVIYNPYFNPLAEDQSLIVANPDSPSGIFLKNVSHNPEYASAKAKMNAATIYVPAQKADGTALNDRDPADPSLCLVGDLVADADGTADDNVCQVQPIVVSYEEEVEPYGVSDVFLAVSLDDGATYKRYNLSKTGDRSSFSTEDGETKYGDSRKPVQQVKGNFIAVSWTDKFCSTGRPAYAECTLDANGDPIVDADDKCIAPVYPDLYGVAGSQGSIDYDADPEYQDLGLGEVPYSCVWASRATMNKLGYMDPKGAPVVQLYKSERLTSGSRDALQIFMGGGGGAGFAMAWQEDPDGLRLGSAAGPGDGGSGATTNNQTDVWYSWVGWGQKFSAIDTADVPSGDPQDTNEDGTPRVRALYPFSVPVRITDNAACNEDNYLSPGRPWCAYDFDQDAEGKADYCDHFVTVDDKNVCVASDGRLLNGDTGASRPNLFLQPYTDAAGNTAGAWAILAYEETKGLGEFVPDYCDGQIADADQEACEFFALFQGKDVYYHSFDFKKPETIAAGLRVNGPYRDPDGHTYWLDDTVALPYTPAQSLANLYPADSRYVTENARRIRFMLQGAGMVPTTASTGRTPLLALWKQGIEGKGGPSDIMLARMSAPLGSLPADDGYNPKLNPYAASNFTCTAYDGVNDPATCLAGRVTNMSAVTVEGTDEDTEGGVPKVTEWSWSLSNLLDESYANPYDNAIAHRGQIRGGFVVMGYSWTPNWAAARNANDVYNFYVRRSFDGGQTWTTDPRAKVLTQHCQRVGDIQGEGAELECTDYAAGVPEPPRNVSLLKNTKYTVAEPRVVSPPGTIKACVDRRGAAAPCLREDKLAPNVVFISYGTAVNADENVNTDLSDDDDEPIGRPADLFYARSTNYGTTFEYSAYGVLPEDGYEPVDHSDPEVIWDWTALAKDSGGVFSQQGEAQLRSTPAGNYFYACWLEEDEAGDAAE